MDTLQVNGKFSDVTLLVGDKQFAAHKAILIARSPVFAAMFSHPTKELLENRATLHDIEANVFEDLLKHIYSGKVSNLEENALDLFATADMVFLSGLSKFTVDFDLTNLMCNYF